MQLHDQAEETSPEVRQTLTRLFVCASKALAIGYVYKHCVSGLQNMISGGSIWKYGEIIANGKDVYK